MLIECCDLGVAHKIHTHTIACSQGIIELYMRCILSRDDDREKSLGLSSTIRHERTVFRLACFAFNGRMAQMIKK